MDGIGEMLGDVMVACAILLCTVVLGAIFFWKRPGSTSDLSKRGEEEQ